MSPSVTMLSFVLAHIYIISGKFPQALVAARAAYNGSPEDVDAVALHHLVNQVTLRLPPLEAPTLKLASQDLNFDSSSCAIGLP